MVKLQGDFCDGMVSLSSVLWIDSFTHSLHFRVWSPSLNLSTIIMSSQAPNNAVEEDYQLWDPREREDTRLGKKFVVRSSKLIIYIEKNECTKKLCLFQYVGAALGLGGVGYMARNFKNKPKDMKLSVYLIHTRLLGQGTVIGDSGHICSKTLVMLIIYYLNYRCPHSGHAASNVWTVCKEVQLVTS